MSEELGGREGVMVIQRAMTASWEPCACVGDGGWGRCGTRCSGLAQFATGSMGRPPPDCATCDGPWPDDVRYAVAGSSKACVVRGSCSGEGSRHTGKASGLINLQSHGVGAVTATAHCHGPHKVIQLAFGL